MNTTKNFLSTYLHGFEKHKGYGTKAHIEAILKYGPCKYHRPSFLKKIYNKK